MKKYFLMLLASLGVALTSYSQETAKQIFESPKLSEEIVKHQTVAILPFEVSIIYRKQPKNFSVEANKEQEKSMSTSLQGSMYTFLLKKGRKYTVEFQDVDKTNILLKKAGMMDNLNMFTKDEIAKILGVDAVIGGKFQSEQSKSELGAVVTTVVLGGTGGKTGSGTTTFTINNGADGSLLWRFYKTMDDYIFRSTDDLVERMMRKVSRNFPYVQ